MAVVKKHSSVERFGSRYGKTIRDKVARIEKRQKQKHCCPYCSYNQVKRIAAGIWQCKKCSTKFTGKAYSFDKKVIKEAN